MRQSAFGPSRSSGNGCTAGATWQSRQTPSLGCQPPGAESNVSRLGIGVLVVRRRAVELVADLFGLLLRGRLAVRWRRLQPPLIGGDEHRGRGCDQRLRLVGVTPGLPGDGG